MPATDDLKLKTARTLKWNSIDRLSSQVLYAVTGIVLANLLTKQEFGLVGAIMVFQAFATLFVDSGFSNALIQRKSPTDTDYSTVFYFNVGVSVIIYAVLWLSAPLIDALFNAGGELIPLSRVMFLSFILNATAIVQTNRLMKQMNVRMIAVSNAAGLVVSGALGVWLALEGWGAWAIVWQSVTLSAVKSLILWLSSSWLPKAVFSIGSLRSIFAVGIGIMTSSFLNILFQNIYSFIIGAYYNLSHLGCYTQADKWSKMGIQSMAQILTASFLPVLSGVQDDRERMLRAIRKMNRFTSYLLFPIMLTLIAAAQPIFHILFSTKWDDAIILFQILVARGIFVVLASLYNNYILALGRSKVMVGYEVVKDVLMVVAIIITLPYGMEALVWGQMVAAMLFFSYAVGVTHRIAGYHWRHTLTDSLPYCIIATVIAVGQWLLLLVVPNPWLCIGLQLSALLLYISLNHIFNSAIQNEVLGFALGRFRRRRSC